jgi:phage head maturation protease
MTDDNEEGYIVEYYAVGNSVKVTAIDPATLLEVSIVGEPSASRQQLAELAIRKLRYVQNKGKEE